MLNKNGIEDVIGKVLVEGSTVKAEGACVVVILGLPQALEIILIKK